MEGRYEVELLWKESHPSLPDNYNLSLKRLHGVSRRLNQDPDVLREYDSIIKDQIQRDIVEPMLGLPCIDTIQSTHKHRHHASRLQI